MATLEQLSAALVKADAAGNAADAKALADAIRQMQTAPSGAGMPAQRKPPTTYERVREFITPTVEMLGAAGGGLLGAYSNPEDALAGAVKGAAFGAATKFGTQRLPGPIGKASYKGSQLLPTQIPPQLNEGLIKFLQKLNYNKQEQR